MSPDVLAGWEAALDDLERSLDTATAVLDGYDGPQRALPWQPPPVDGPLPEGLRQRAVALQDRQIELLEMMYAARSDLRTRRHLLARMDAGRPSRSLYLDQSV